MWIRSQDKESLINCNEFYIVNLFKSGFAINCKTCTIVKELGKYSTKEKALKVLYMIQKHLTSINGIIKINTFLNEKEKRKLLDSLRLTPVITSGMEYIPFNESFFQMPQDEEVLEDE